MVENCNALFYLQRDNTLDLLPAKRSFSTNNQAKYTANVFHGFLVFGIKYSFEYTIIPTPCVSIQSYKYFSSINIYSPSSSTGNVEDLSSFSKAALVSRFSRYFAMSRANMNIPGTPLATTQDTDTSK